MLLAAKLAAPASAPLLLWRELVEEVCANGSATITAPWGALLPEALAATVRMLRGEPLWVALGPEDRDPGVLLYSLLRAAQRLAPQLGAHTEAALAQYIGLADSWPPIFRALAADLAANLPDGCVLVLEHAEQLDTTGATLGLLNSYMLRNLSDTHPWILISAWELPRAGLPPETLRISAAGLRLPLDATIDLAAASECPVSGPSVRRVMTLLGGRADSLYSVLRMAARLGAPTLTALIERSSSAEQLLMRIARAAYGLDSPGDHAALDAGRRLGYTHPTLATADGSACAPHQAWLLPLSDGWQRLRDVWLTILPRVVRPGEQASPAALCAIADALVQQDALIPAVDLYQELGAFDQAAAVINAALDRMMRLGQWRTLERWLERLPAAVLHGWPWLLYARGELAAGQHDFSQAQHAFTMATQGFTQHQNQAGACQSLLAESTLAHWQGDVQQAAQHTLAALRQAEHAGLAWHQGWATWQLVELALDNDSLAGAMLHLERALQAATLADEQPLAALLGQAERLLSQRRSLNERREQHRQAYFTLEQAEQALDEQVRRLITAPQRRDLPTLADRPWTATPLMLKLSAPNAAPAIDAKRSGLWHSLMAALGLTRSEALRRPPPTPPELPVLLLNRIDAPATPLEATEAARNAVIPADQPAPETAAKPHLTLIAHLLGPFRVSLNDDPIVNWPSGRGRALLKYMLLHHANPTPRDVLMELLWPEAEPDEARNRLNVAMHGLRQAFRTVTDQPIVLFQREDATYRLNPNLTIWLDVLEFERSVAAGRQHEAAGMFTDAITGYEQAANLYQGDFLAEDPYDDWPMLRREQLRLAYLDVLERLGQIYFSQGRYGACATLCQQILARDNCREDAHCRLMRCYSRQGQHHLALRQYQACLKALHDELGVEPLPATVRLADAIRRHEAV